MRRLLFLVSLAGLAVLAAVAVPRSDAATTVPTLRPFCTTGPIAIANPDWEPEIALDTEMVSAICPPTSCSSRRTRPTKRR